mgnify:FL=1
MHQQLTQEYSALFDIQLSDLDSLKLMKEKAAAANSPQTIYQLQWL